MALTKLGSKYGAFQRQGQAWFCTTGLSSDITVEVDGMLFHLHKFPLISRSGKMMKLVAEASLPTENNDGLEDNIIGDEVQLVRIQGMPGGPEAFELAAKFCYGGRVELMASNVAALRCAAAFLEMTEEYGEKNLTALTDSFLNQVVVRSWKDSIRALKSCEGLLPLAEELQIVKKCVDSIAVKACTEPSLFGWPMMENCSLQSPDGTLLWNGISTGARPRNSRLDWWFEDLSALNLPLFKCVITAMEERGLRSESIGGAIMFYAKKSIPGLYRRQEEDKEEVLVGVSSRSRPANSSPLSVTPCEAEQVFVLETIESLLPLEEGTASTKFLLGLLRIAIILNASLACRANLERRIGLQLHQATLDDLLIPSYSYSQETLYDIDCVQRIVNHFVGSDKALEATNLIMSPPAPPPNLVVLSPPGKFTPLMAVARLLDAYLAEVAPDANLKPLRFQELADLLPEYARVSDDGLYRAIDMYLKAHSHMTESEREGLCGLMDCQKLSLEACTHAAQNERLPLRSVVQVLFLEQMQLREAIAGYMKGDDAPATPLPANEEGPPQRPPTTSGALRVDMVGLRSRIGELERECAHLRNRLSRGGRRSKPTLATWAAIIGCRAPAGDVSGPLQDSIKSRVAASPLSTAPSPAQRPRSSYSHSRGPPRSSPQFSSYSSPS